MTISKTVRPGSFAPTQWTFGARETGSMKTILLAAIGSLRTLPSPRRTGGRPSRPGEPRTGSPASRRCRDRPRRDRIRTRTPCISTWSFWPSRCSFPVMGNARIISFPSNGPQPVIPPPYSRISSNSSFPAPHRGQTQSSGRRRNGVPGSTPLAGSPTSGSYTYAQTMHRYLAIAELLLGLSGTGGMISIATKEPQHRRGDLVGMVRPADAAAGAQAPPLGFREPRGGLVGGGAGPGVAPGGARAPPHASRNPGGGEREARGDSPDPHPRGEN